MAASQEQLAEVLPKLHLVEGQTTDRIDKVQCSIEDRAALLSQAAS
jgi:hypothetical protein